MWWTTFVYERFIVGRSGSCGEPLVSMGASLIVEVAHLVSHFVIKTCFGMFH